MLALASSCQSVVYSQQRKRRDVHNIHRQLVSRAGGKNLPPSMLSRSTPRCKQQQLRESAALQAAALRESAALQAAALRESAALQAAALRAVTLRERRAASSSTQRERRAASSNNSESAALLVQIQSYEGRGASQGLRERATQLIVEIQYCGGHEASQGLRDCADHLTVVRTQTCEGREDARASRTAPLVVQPREIPKRV
jgi:hypothetical protein